MLSLLQAMESWAGSGNKVRVVWKVLAVHTLSLTDAALDVFGYLLMTIFRRDLADGQLLSSERGYHQHVGTMLDEELYTVKMAVLGCHNQWSLRGREEGGDERREKREGEVKFQLVEELGANHKAMHIPRDSSLSYKLRRTNLAKSVRVVDVLLS